MAFASNASHVTFLYSEKIVKRPYKIVLEVRKSNDGYSVTLVSRDTRAIGPVARALKNRGYQYIVYIDKYQHVRLHLRKLNSSEIEEIKDVAREYIGKKSEPVREYLSLS